MSFVALPITTDPAELADAAVAYLQEQIPGWEPVDGQVEMWVTEAMARLTTEAVTVASTMGDNAFQEFGLQFLDLEQEPGAEATVTTTWTMMDSSGWTVPAGTLVGYRRTGDDAVLFEVQDDIVVAPGGSTATGVVLTAVDTGTDSNEVPIGELELIDALSYVDSVVVTEGSSGGEDPETDEDYRDRLHAEMMLLSPRPILPNDFSVLARRVDGVYRALALNLYNPDDETWDNERYCTVALVDENGAACSSLVKAAALAYLDALREINFVVKVMDPTFTTINVVFTITVMDGYTDSEVVEACETAIGEYLDPAVWAGGDQSPPVWESGRDTVRYLELATILNNVEGVDYVASLLVNGTASDEGLSGDAPLPAIGSVTGVVGGMAYASTTESEITTSTGASGTVTTP